MSNKSTYLIVPGVHKGGTTSLFQYLTAHPRIFSPLKKELHYFTPIVYNESTKEINQYLKNFENATDDQFRLDVSPSYLYGGKKLIDELKNLGNIKILLILRRPTQRFVSFYKQGISLGFIPSDEPLETYFSKSKAAFEEFQKTGVQIDTFYNRSLREGCYSMYLEEWTEAFGENMKIIYFENFIKTPKSSMIEICEFLDIPNVYDDYSFTVENKSFKPKSQALSKFVTSIYSKGEGFFRRNQKIKNLLKRVYLLMNKSQYAQTGKEVLDELDQFYKPFNESLTSMLKAKDIKTPNW
jgi:Sulfotransferase domain